MEKQMRAERAKRAAILDAEGNRTAKVLEAEGQAQAIEQVFLAVHHNDSDPKLLAYQYLQTLPQLAQGPGSTFFVIPSEVTAALQSVSRAFTETLPRSPATRDAASSGRPAEHAAADAAQATEAAADAVAEAAEPEHLPRIPAGVTRSEASGAVLTTVSGSCCAG